MTFDWTMKPAKPDSRDSTSTADSSTVWFKNGMVHTYTTDDITVWDVRPTLEMAVKSYPTGGYYKFDLRNDTVTWKSPFGMLDAGTPFEVIDKRAQLVQLYADVEEVTKDVDMSVPGNRRMVDREVDDIYNKIEELEEELNYENNIRPELLNRLDELYQQREFATEQLNEDDYTTTIVWNLDIEIRDIEEQLGMNYE